MAPSKITASTSTAAPANTEAGGAIISGDDLGFLIDCLKHVAGGPISIDCNSVALVRGNKNPRSVQNRIAKFRKEYGIPLHASTSAKNIAAASRTADDSDNDDDAEASSATPKSASKRKGAPKRATPAAKKVKTMANAKKEKGKNMDQLMAEADARTLASHEEVAVEVEFEVELAGEESEQEYTTGWKSGGIEVPTIIGKDGKERLVTGRDLDEGMMDNYKVESD